MSIEREFIPYEQALALKELGFDEDCVAAYKTNYRVGDLTWGGVNGFVPFYKEQIIKQNEIKWVKVIQAPLYQQAFRWFYWKHHIKAEPLNFIGDKCTYRIHNGDYNTPFFHIPEEAELECLKKLIEIVKESKNGNN